MEKLQGKVFGLLMASLGVIDFEARDKWQQLVDDLKPLKLDRELRVSIFWEIIVEFDKLPLEAVEEAFSLFMKHTK